MRIVGMSDKTVTITNCLFENNTTAGSGGVLYMDGGTLISRNNIYKGNSSTKTDGASGGGAIFINGAPDCSFDGDMFISNTASNATGSAILASNSSYTLRFNNCVFSQNSASHRGCIRGMVGTGKMYFNACTFSNNTINQYGSALQLNNPAAIHNCVFYVNTNSSATGASNIYFDKNLLLSNTSIKLTGNAACGLWVAGGDNSTIVNNIIYNVHGGSAIKITSGTLTSYGHSLYKSGSGTTIDGTITLNDAGHTDSEYAVNYGFVGEPYWVLRWTKWANEGEGTPPAAPWEFCTPERVEAAIDAFDTATSMGVKSWLNSLGALNTDRRGIARSTTAIWPGSYDNSATSSLE
jgi:predicted outer membrane repeat protein